MRLFILQVTFINDIGEMNMYTLGCIIAYVGIAVFIIALLS